MISQGGVALAISMDIVNAFNSLFWEKIRRAHISSVCIATEAHLQLYSQKKNTRSLTVKIMVLILKIMRCDFRRLNLL